MKRLRLALPILGLIVVTALVGDAQTPSVAGGGTSAERAVIQAERDRFTAMQKADVATLEKLLGPELSYIHSNASLQDKSAFLADIKTGAIKYLMVEPSDMKARVFGNMAIVTGTASVHVIQNGNDLTIRIRYTNAHINRAGAWQMVAWQSTRFPA